MDCAEAISLLTADGQPYETRWAEGPRGRLLVYPNLPATLRELYSVNATDAEFLVFEAERRTFAHTVQEAAAVAHVLVHRFGVRPGDTVAISMRNYPEWMLAFMAATSVGAIAVGMNSLWQTDEMEYGLRDSGAKVLFADRERAEQWASMTPRPELAVLVVRADVAPGGAALLHELLPPVGSVTMPDVQVTPDDPAVILYTSGSTGRPKGVLSSHRAVVSALYGWEVDAVQLAHRRSPSAADPPALPSAALLGIPLFHVMGLNGGFLSSFRSQRRVVCMTKWDPAHAAELIERERITSFSAPPAMTGDLVREAQRSARDLSSLRSVGGGGAARPPEQVRQIDRTFPNAGPGIGWGMTETNAVGTIISGPDYVLHPESAGYAVPGAELRVVGDDGVPLPAGSQGELQVRGSTMFTEYWNRPDATAESFDGDWFRTGDVAYLDDDGLLYIVDRIKDLIIRGGENIGCGHVEAALAAHPHVIEAAVYSVPDERLGEEVGATVFGTSELDLDDLRGFLLQHLARHEVPRYLFAAEQPLPRTASGKLFKRQVRDEAISHL
jgi:long-chain acyl-CoA synthetase